MNIFTQRTEYDIDDVFDPDCINDLPAAIRRHTDWNYSCKKTPQGCFLKPVFRNMPYTNSFVPEIDIVISRQDTKTMLQLTGRPVKFVRVFMGFWFSALLLLEVMFLILAITSKLEQIFPIFIPLGMCLFGYLLCLIGTKVTFGCVVKAMKEELH